MNKHQIVESKARFQKQIVVLENQIKNLEKKQMQKAANMKEAEGITLPDFKLSTVNKYASQIINIIKQIDPKITTSSDAKFTHSFETEPGTYVWNVEDGSFEISNKKLDGSEFENIVLLDVTIDGKPIYLQPFEEEY